MYTLHLLKGIKEVGIADVEQYLERKGWVKTATSNPNALVYEGPLAVDGKPITMVLPARRSQPDADRRINEVIRTVATIESESPEALVEVIMGSAVRRHVVSRSMSPKKPRVSAEKRVEEVAQ